MRKFGLVLAATSVLAGLSILLTAPTTVQSKRLSEGFVEELRKIGAPPAPAKAAPAPKKAAPKKAEPKKEEPKKAEPAKAEPKKAEPMKAAPKK